MARGSIRSGLLAGTLLSISALAAHLPMRLVSARIQAGFGARFRDHFLGGLCSDIVVLLPVIAIFWLALFPLLWAGRRRGRGPLAATAIAGYVLLGTFFALVVLGGIAAAEFRLQRGLWPAFWDVGTGVGDAGFWSASLGTLGMSRYLCPGLASLALILALHYAIFRILGSPPALTRPLPFLSATLVPMVLVFGLCRVAYLRAAKGVFPSVRDRDVELASPLRQMAGSIGRVSDRYNSQLAAAAWLRQVDFTRQEERSGAAMLGLPAPGRHDPHGPARRSYVRALPGEEQPETEPVALARQLSRALFAGSGTAPGILEVALESVRTADVRALTPGALPRLTPFLNALHDGSHGLPVRSLASRLTFQGGIRTSQALAGFVCGLGHLPFQWSAARDFGRLPMRCLPDVLHDAGYRNRFFVGANLAFDRMDLFFRSHATEPYGQESFPRGTPRGAWGVTDRALFRAVIANLEAGGAEVPRWDFVLTMTNHGPYRPPPDLPEEVVRRVDADLSERGLSPPAEDRNRLLTLAYTDFAAEEFLREYYARDGHGRTLVVIHADHATTDPLTGGGSGGDPTIHFRPEAAGIPFLILVPRECLEGAADPMAAAGALERLETWLQEHPLSGNDVPTLILALLSEARPLRELPVDLRWHTMGGQATSPWFEAPSRQGGQVWGIDAFSRLFVLDAHGKPFGLREVAIPASSAEGVARSRSLIRPAAAVIRRLSGELEPVSLPP